MMSQKQEDDAKKAESERADLAAADIDDDDEDHEAKTNNNNERDDRSLTINHCQAKRGESTIRNDSNSLREEGSLFSNGDDDEKTSRASTKPQAPKHILDKLKKKSRNPQDVDAALIRMGSNTSIANEQELQDKSSSIGVEGGENQESSSTVSQQQESNTPGSAAVAPLSNNDDQTDQQPQQQREAVPQYPRLQLSIMFATFLPLLIANLIKNRFTDCGSSVFWLLTIGTTIYNLAVAIVYRKYLSNLNDKIKIGEADAELIPFKWNNKSTIYFPIVCVSAGCAASSLGVGGGIIINFLLLESGLIPEEVSATGGFATFSVSIEALLQFIIQGSIRVDYFGTFFLAGLCATALGQLVMMPEIKRRGWRFLIIGCLGLIMGGSMLAVSVFGIYETVTLVKANGNIGFGRLCHERKLKVHTSDVNS